MISITVAVCTYNGSKRLPAVLACLRSQQVGSGLDWEVVVVDNNSQDCTADVVRAHQKDWPGISRLRYTFEHRQGLAYARQRAIDEAHGALVGFLDDDNLADQGWVQSACNFAAHYPQAGAYGSRVLPHYEVKPPPDFQRIAPFLAIVDRGRVPLMYKPEKKVLPPGAGLVVRRQVWLNYVPEALQLVGRVNGGMLAGEDLEALLYIQRAGWEIWYAPDLLVRHQIPSERLQEQYLLKLFRGIGLSRYRTRMLSWPIWLRPVAIAAYTTNDLRKILHHLYKYKGSRGLIAKCELELYRSSLTSPLYTWGRNIEKLSNNQRT
ncbi:MAG: hormogonium polysaccharide biosynthesis glycosyltransferase HpsE [Cyanobacteria bacterium P01_H01_bin.121]